MKDQEIQFVREFNRFYTNIIGLLDDHLLQSPFTLPEARILYELYHRQPCTASAIMEAIRIDKGYLSRVLTQFFRKGLLIKKKSKEDARATYLSLSAKGNSEFEKINLASIDQVKDLLQNLSAEEKSNLVDHMNEIRKVLEKIEKT